MRYAVTSLVVLGLALLVGCGGSAPGGPAAAGKPAASAPAGGGAPAGASPAGETAVPSAVATLRAAAATEGVLNVYVPSTFAKEGLEQMQAAFNRHHGLNVEFKPTLAGSMTRDAARVVTEVTAGQTPAWDMMLVTDSQYATMFHNGALERTDWAVLGMPYSQAIYYDGTAVAFAAQFVAPAYNPTLVAPAEAPKDWNDLLDPRWRGKIGATTATHHWGRLAQLWGDERTTRFVEALATQQPVLGQPAEMQSRLLVGEVQLIASHVSSQVHDAKKIGAPIEFVDGARPLIATHYQAGVIKGAAHPSIARLLAVFLMTPEAQVIWAASQGETSLFIEGSAAAQYVQGKELLSLDERYAAEQLDPLTQKYGRLIGFR